MPEAGASSEPASPVGPEAEGEARREEAAALTAGSIDLEELTERVYRLLLEEARLERERLGRY